MIKCKKKLFDEFDQIFDLFLLYIDLLLYFNFIMDRGNAFSCMKYTLILCNVFGFILAIFNALFGIGYPQEKWPGGYTGGQMAIFSLFVMAFTTIGYCGAQHHKGYLLIVYGKNKFFFCFISNLIYKL